MTDSRSDQRGSVLVAVVAAMLILLLAGTALTEMHAAQRLGSVQKIDSTRAYWVAEAGIWHSARTGESVTEPVPFAGWTYTATNNGDEYTATARRGKLVREVTTALDGAHGPLNKPRSAASAGPVEERINLELFSLSPQDIQWTSFSLSADRTLPKLEKVKLGSYINWYAHAGLALPIVGEPMNQGSADKYTIEALGQELAELVFTRDLPEDDPIEVTLELHFKHGESSKLTFTLFPGDEP